MMLVTATKSNYHKDFSMAEKRKAENLLSQAQPAKPASSPTAFKWCFARDLVRDFHGVTQQTQMHILVHVFKGSELSLLGK